MKQYTDIWMVKKVGVKWEDPIRLTNHEDADTNPQWHPGGKKFAFLSSGREPGTRRNGTSENITSAEREGSASNKIMLMSLMGGEPSELLQHSTNIASYQWSPDGNYIAFRASDPQSEQTKSTRRSGRDINIEDEPGNATRFLIMSKKSQHPEFKEGKYIKEYWFFCS